MVAVFKVLFILYYNKTETPDGWVISCICEIAQNMIWQQWCLQGG